MKKENRLAAAGRELIKGNFGSAYKSLTSGGTTMSLDPSKHKSNGMWFFGSDGRDYHFQYGGLNSSLKAYSQCPPVSAIINRKAQAYINGRTWILDKTGKESTSETANRVRQLIMKPNPLQSWKQFEAQSYIYKLLFGYTIILPIKPKGFPNHKAKALWNIPPFLVDIEETEKLFYQSEGRVIKQLVLTYKGQRTTLDVEDVYIMKDFTPSFDSLVIPESRIKSLELPINNIIGAYESRNVLINYRGALGILSADKDQSGPIPVTESEKKELQSDFRRYGLRKSQWQLIISKAALKWQPMGYPTKDLMLFEEIEDDVMRVCDSLNYPYRLLSSNKSTSLAGSDIAEFKKLLYQDAIIPEAESDYEQWTEFFGISQYGLRVDKDYTHLPILQEDKVRLASARKVLNDAKKIEWDNDLITLNQWLTALEEDPIGPDGDYRKSQMPKESTMLAVILGVGGVQSLIAVLSDTTMSEQAKKATLEILFQIQPADAARMVVSGPQSTSTTVNTTQE